ncbi:MAG: preprotein translocase subunit SecG [Candidatus Andeanibacterium colombiense]|uniref:Protein-export membrane protein SecG n=1 Tax=Candidatus Andeanibacterium colombiense TaxID=3121345 RepID=A0AAJ6BPZ1_9SPHN|nr:MAG: preprotein translocase subunit SecG [Sphingomonadaceae bacterium]
MSLFLFLTVVQAIVALALVLVVLMQRSEGGGLGMGGGGSPAGLMSARGAADFLTRATTILATIFVSLSILLAAIGVGATENRKIDSTLDRTVNPEQGGGHQKDLLGNSAAQPAQAPAQAPASTTPAGSPDPLKGAAQ